MVAATCTTSTAGVTRSQKGALHKQLVRFYHADGYIKSIGHVAYRTIYSSNPHIRHVWRRTTRRLIRVRSDAEQKIHAIRAPVDHLTAWECIHKYEGAWNSNTGNGYYGGLQMDLGFQRTYGADLLRSKGTADHWTPKEQMQVAEKAYQSRGFYPWPNTARYCGLI